VVCFSDHIACHVPYALVYNLRHSGHDALCLRTIKTLALQALYKVMGIEVKVITRSCGAESPVKLRKER
jgi:hypothetical protein